MPAGISNPVVGYFAFCAVKFTGYSLAAHFISRSYRRTDRNAFLVGGARTLIGMAAGAGYYGLWQLIPVANGADIVVYLAGLVPVRIAEWWLLLWLFYRRSLRRGQQDWSTVGCATVWSYILDIPALIGFFVTAGVWVC